MRHRALAAALAVCAAVLGAGCGDDGDEDVGSGTGSSATMDAAEPTDDSVGDGAIGDLDVDGAIGGLDGAAQASVGAPVDLDACPLVSATVLASTLGDGADALADAELQASFQTAPGTGPKILACVFRADGLIVRLDDSSVDVPDAEAAAEQLAADIEGDVARLDPGFLVTRCVDDSCTAQWLTGGIGASLAVTGLGTTAAATGDALTALLPAALSGTAGFTV